MSMNKTCPISNLTSAECSDGMSLLLSQTSRFNEPIPCPQSESGLALTIDDESNRPVRSLKKWEDLRRALDEQPSDNSIGRRNFVNVAPF